MIPSHGRHTVPESLARGESLATSLSTRVSRWASAAPFRRLNKENIPSRAYIAFKRDDQLATFAREYDGHLFRDKAGERHLNLAVFESAALILQGPGNEAQAVVEFSPYQKVPSEKKKVDARLGTIEKGVESLDRSKHLQNDSASTFPADEDYVSFLESLKSPAANSEPPSMDALSEFTPH